MRARLFLDSRLANVRGSGGSKNSLPQLTLTGLGNSVGTMLAHRSRGRGFDPWPKTPAMLERLILLARTGAMCRDFFTR